MVEKKQTFSWPPLESDPVILTEYMHKIGMSKDWELSEVIGLDPELLAMVPKTAIAFVLAYDYTTSKPDEEKENEKEKETKPPEVDYFMWQTRDLDNACGLIACLHAVFNNREKVKAEAESPLAELWDIVAKQNPEERAKTLNGFTKIQEAHIVSSAEGQSNYVQASDQERYHFICFTRNNKEELVELDGISYGPKLLNGTSYINHSQMLTRRVSANGG